MHSLNLQATEALLNAQLLRNRDRIKALTVLLKGKTRSDIVDDIIIFREFNKISMDTAREFPHYDPQKRVVEAKHSLAAILSKLGRKTLNSYLDVGCGMGFSPRAAFEMGCPVSVGIDITENAQWSRYADGAKDRLRYVCADISSSAEPKGQYDLVTSFAAFEHFADPPGMLHALSRYVGKGGHLHILFSPIYYSTNGHHMYRDIQIPWYHLLFTERVCRQYYLENDLVEKSQLNWFNRWSAIDYLMLFTGFQRMRSVEINLLWDLQHYWFAKVFPQFLPPYGLEELMIGGFEASWIQT